MRTSNWGRWGDEDERGALNLLTPERIVEAAQLVREGRVYQLGLSIQPSGVPYFKHRPPALHFMARDGGDYAAGVIRPDNVGTADDWLGLATHGTTHIDALCHLWYDGTMYNGFSSNEVTSNGAGRNGIEKIGPIVARGVMLDVAALHGVDHLAPDHGIGAEELEACEARQRVRVGADRRHMDHPRACCGGGPGDGLGALGLDRVKRLRAAFDQGADQIDRDL